MSGSERWQHARPPATRAPSWLLAVVLAAASAAARADPPRAAPAAGQGPTLSALKMFDMSLLRAKDRHVEVSRLDLRVIALSVLDGLQREIPEMLVEPCVSPDLIAITVGDHRELVDTGDLDSPFHLARKVKSIFRIIEANRLGATVAADRVREEYVAINAMLATLDAHSSTAAPLPIGPPLGAVGAVIRRLDHQIVVTRATVDGPASRAGIRPLDRIVQIDDERTANMTGEVATDLMQGPLGSRVALWVERAGSDQPQRFDVARAAEQPPEEPAVASRRLRNGVGVLRIARFDRGTARAASAAMKLASSAGARAWVLDLRGCTGGLVDEAVQLADLFIGSGTLVTIVSRGTRDSRQAERSADDVSTPLIVLVDAETAAGAEIVASALADSDRALLVGERTFGNGTIQEVYDNPDGGKLRLTIASWLTPSGRSIQAVGVVPDIALRSVSIPPQNHGPGDEVRLLAPSRAAGEVALSGHLISTLAVEAELPAFELVLAPTARTVSQSEVEAEVASDAELGAAVALAAASKSATRSAQRRELLSTAAAIQSREALQVSSSLRALGVDWAAPPANPLGGAVLSVALAVAPAGEAHAGDVVSVTATVKNTGTAAAWRVLARLHCDDGVFDGRELPIGKIAPGETRTFTTQVQVPIRSLDRFDRITVGLTMARGAQATLTSVRMRIHAAARPASSPPGAGPGTSLALAASAVETTAPRYALKGTVADNAGLEDMYILVGNASANVIDKKVYYRSGRNIGTAHQMAFEADLPLSLGSNEVTVVVRNASHATTSKSIVITRYPTATPSTAKAASAGRMR
jgi:carboxyl-terminal processing protease